MAKHNEDETENAINAALLHSSSFVNWLMMTKVLQSFQKIVFPANLWLCLSLYTLKMLKISELNQRLSLRHLSSAKDGWLCKIFTSFSQGNSGSRAFIDKSSNVGDHPTERFTDHPKSKRYLTSVKNKQCHKCQSVIPTFGNWQQILPQLMHLVHKLNPFSELYF